MRTPQERRAEIENLPTEDLRYRLMSGRFGELRSFAEAELAKREQKEESERLSRAEIREEESLSISRKALLNSDKAVSMARLANTIAVIAAIIAIIAIVVTKR